MRPPSVFSTRRQFLQNSAALFASGAVPFADASADAETSGQTGISFVSDQEKRRRELWDLLGDLPWRHRPGLARLLSTEEHEGYTVERLVLDLNGIEPVPALMLIPHKRQRPTLGLLYIHWHGGMYDLGKEQLLRGVQAQPAYASVCAEALLSTNPQLTLPPNTP